jgi:cation transport ATPase
VGLQRHRHPSARRFSSHLRGHDGAVAVYFEAAAVITVLVLLGQVLELRAREATSGAIKALLDLAPKTARRIRPDGTDEEVQIAVLSRGTAFVSGRARRCRSMVKSLKADPRSTSRW